MLFDYQHVYVYIHILFLSFLSRFYYQIKEKPAAPGLVSEGVRTIGNPSPKKVFLSIEFRLFQSVKDACNFNRGERRPRFICSFFTIHVIAS
jgi:hypothetical protein